MKILDREAFMRLPAGTMFCIGQPWYFNGLCIKGDSIKHDGVLNDWSFLCPEWVESADDGDQIMRLTNMKENGASYPMQESYGRDGRFDKDDLFLVFESDDLEKLAALVETARKVSA